MKLFQIAQKKIAILGITSAQSTQKTPFNWKIIRVYFIYGVAWTSSALFLFKEAETFDEYTNNIYITSATAMIMFCFTVVVFKMAKLFQFISDCGKVTERGEQLNS